MINQIEKNTLEFQKKVSKKYRKDKAQFFTTLSIAKYMSSITNNYNNKDSINLLDCGAGTGILACSLIDKLTQEGFTGQINIDLYENDPMVVEVLIENINIYKLKHKNLNINIFQENFILANKDKWNDKEFEGKYDVIISNPPYKKLAKSSEESIAMESVVYGQPNIYFLFMAMSVKLLRLEGEMIFITPRSFTSGAYFKVFRNYFLDNTNLTNIHIFNSRNDVFKGEEILQETIITRAIKSLKNKNRFINIAVSEDADFENSKQIIADCTDLITNCDNKFILLPSSDEEIDILNMISQYKDNLISLGFKLKTGKVVDFRATEYLVNKANGAVPLFWPDNFIDNKITYVNNENNFRYIISSDKSKNMLQENKNYILIKRFASKEENRRIQAAIYNKNDFNFDKIGIENHVNFIEKINGLMTKDEQYGLFCIFNSTILDKYYRIVNGNTQVNATEFNAIPLPNIDIIVKIGRELLKSDKMDTYTCDLILSKFYRYQWEGEMSKLEDARDILASIKCPRTNDLACNVLLGLANIKQDTMWEDAQNKLYTTRELMDFMRDEYDINYRANTRETVRKDVIHYFLQSSIVEANRDKPDRATNSPKYCYSLVPEFLNLIQNYGSEKWNKVLKEYKDNVESLVDKYKKEREVNRIPVIINGNELTFSPGKHNQLQKAIIEDFAPIFAPGAEVLYVGDTDKKDLVKNVERLDQLGVDMQEHTKLPDVVLYSKDKDWIYFIESVTSVGPMNDKRIIEIGEMTQNCSSGKVYVTAFLDRITFKKFAAEIAWETEVWIAERPEHMVHYNGDRFFGPREI